MKDITIVSDNYFDNTILISFKTVKENVEKIFKQFQEEKFNYLESNYILDQAKEALKIYAFVNLGGENNAKNKSETI